MASARAQFPQQTKECSAVGATGVRVDLRARKGSSTLLSPGDGATYRRDGESMLQTYFKKASSTCTIPSIEKTALTRTTSTPQPRNEDRQELGDYRWVRHSRHERHRGGTGCIAHHIPDTSSITSFVFKNHGVHLGLYPAAITSAPTFAATPSASGALRSRSPRSARS